MAACRKSRPTSSMAKPKMNSPNDFNLFFLAKKNVNAMVPASSARLKPLPPLPPSPKSRMIHEVMVVPMLAPIITAMAPANDIRPALTNDTTITVVADELWMTDVTVMPARMPLAGLPVILPRMLRIRLPATFCRPLLISVIPKRKMPRAPKKLIAIVTMFQILIFSIVFQMFI